MRCGVARRVNAMWCSLQRYHCLSPNAAGQRLPCAQKGPDSVQTEGSGNFSIDFSELWIRPYKAFW